jgi:Zn-dependent metalloprotease
MDMRYAATCPHSIYCIVPPYVFSSIVKNVEKAPSAQRDQMRGITLQTLQLDRVIRDARVAQHQQTRFRSLLRHGLRFSPLSELLESAQAGVKQRNIYSAENKQRLPGTLVRKEGDPQTNDPAVDEAYDGLGATYDLFLEEYGRNSIDNRGMALDATVHFGMDYDNAFWNGSQMVFGDGDGVLFNRFTIAVDVTGHELTHGVTQHSAGLIYWGQPGALNESASDVFGSLVKQRSLNQTADQADWLIGEGLLVPDPTGGGRRDALRSMKAPGTAYDDPVLGKDPQPAHMRDFVRTFQDNGGVHINSGIPNHAFYLAATKIGGNAWKQAGKIWYTTLTTATRPLSRFQNFAVATARTAQSLYGANSAEYHAVREAWSEVGINVQLLSLTGWRKVA